MEHSGHPLHASGFGVFEVDLKAGELRKNGLKIRLQEQPFKVLATLLESPGEVVTREELKSRLWTDHTFVDFDHGLASAINRLREALGDSAEVPRYIETLPRRGYRFIAPVDGHPNGAETAAEVPLPAKRARKTIVAYAVALVVVIGLAVLLIVHQLPLPPPQVVGYTQITHDGLPKSLGAVTTPLLTDGLHVFFSLAKPEGGLFSVAAAGGETVAIPTAFRGPCFRGISPDGAQLVICHASGCDITPVLGGASRHLGGEVLSAWFADENTLLCSTGKGISLVKLDGSESRRLVSVEDGIVFWPRLSPDGRVIRFSRYEGKKDLGSIWEVSRDGTNLHPLLPNWKKHPLECCGTWTRDGKYYVFQAGALVGGSSASTQQMQIWAIREKPGLFRKADQKPVQVTAGPMDFYSPAPSKDGKRLFAIGDLHRSGFVRYNFKSQTFEPFLTHVRASGMGLDFSRDGKRVVFRALADSALWRSKTDGTEQLRLTSLPLEVTMPRWSPHEKRIAFSARTPGKPWNAYIISAEGGVPQRVLPEDANQTDVTWSPDGNSLAFGRLYQDAGAGRGGIHIVNLQTHRVRTLPKSGFLYSPRWSPDGRMILALVVSQPPKPFRLFRFDEAKWVELDRKAMGMFPTWSRDSKQVYYAKGGRDSSFYRIRVSDSKIEQLASYQGIRPAIMAPGGPWWGFTPENTPYMRREIAEEEIYALDWETP